MVGVLAVVLMWVLACMGLECWLDGLWGVQGAGMLAAGNASLVVLPGEKPPNCVTLEYWYLDDACSRVVRIYL